MESLFFLKFKSIASQKHSVLYEFDDAEVIHKSMINTIINTFIT